MPQVRYIPQFKADVDETVLPDLLDNVFKNSGHDVIVVRNNTDTYVRAVVAAVTPCSQGSQHNDDELIAAGAIRILGPYPQQQYCDAAGDASFFFIGAGGFPLPDDGDGHPLDVLCGITRLYTQD